MRAAADLVLSGDRNDDLARDAAEGLGDHAHRLCFAERSSVGHEQVTGTERILEVGPGKRHVGPLDAILGTPQRLGAAIDAHGFDARMRDDPAGNIEEPMPIDEGALAVEKHGLGASAVRRPGQLVGRLRRRRIDCQRDRLPAFLAGDCPDVNRQHGLAVGLRDAGKNSREARVPEFGFVGKCALEVGPVQTECSLLGHRSQANGNFRDGVTRHRITPDEQGLTLLQAVTVLGAVDMQQNARGAVLALFRPRVSVPGQQGDIGLVFPGQCDTRSENVMCTCEVTVI